LSRAKMAALVGIRAWNWLPTDVGIGEAVVAGEIETGAVGNSACVVAGNAGIGTGVSKTVAGEIGADETSPVGAGDAEAGGVENCVGAVGLCVGTLENE